MMSRREFHALMFKHETVFRIGTLRIFGHLINMFKPTSQVYLRNLKAQFSES
jgi:hypothetical protein